MVRVRFSFGSRHTGHLENIRKQKKKFKDVASEVIEKSDIILEVLDARFIEETRNKDIEKKIKDSGKKNIYVFNKIDLVDQNKIRRDFRLKPYVFISCTKRIGSSKLREQIKIIIKKMPYKEKYFVGIIGYPNTGKSSLINFLVGHDASSVGNEAGITQGLQKVKMTKNIFILDTPGVISDVDYSMSNNEKISQQVKLGAKSFNRINEPEIAVQKLINDYGNIINNHYGIPFYEDSDLFLEELGKKIGALKKGGVVNTDIVARKVIKDWQNGEIK
jgi:hypothetical protein